MSKRARARERTRGKIVEATAKLHGENGVFDTSWQDIAREADVSVATVYSHFPSLEELLPACGALVMERVKPPQPDSAAEIIGDARGLEQRLGRIAEELFSFYERGGPHIEVDVRERRLPGMDRWEQFLLDLVEALVREALAVQPTDADTVRVICGLLDLPSFRAFRQRGVTPRTAANTVARMAELLVRDQDKQRKRSTKAKETR